MALQQPAGLTSTVAATGIGSSRVPRVLDAIVLVVLAFTALLLVTGGVRLGGVRLERAEDALVAATALAALRHLLRPYVLRPRTPRRWVWGGVVIYTVVLSFITVTRHENLRTHAVDLALYDQMVWAIATVGAPWSTLPDLHGWGDHFTPILYVMAPMYWLLPSAVTMLVVQCVALAVGAFAVWGLGRRALGDDRAAALLAVLYLLNPSLHGINLRDFHPQAMAIPLLLAALYCFETDRPVLFWGAVLLTLSAREDAGLAVLGLGVWALAVRRRPWTGLVAMALGFAWLVVTTRWVIPYFRGEAYSHLDRWAQFGGSVGGIVIGIVTRPLRVLGTVLSPQRLRYLVAIVAPWGGLPLLAPLALLPMLPTLGTNLLSRDEVLFHHRTQYMVYVLPFVTLAAIGGFRRLAARRSPAVAHAAVVLAMLIALAMTARTVNDLMVRWWWPDARTRDVHALAARVPPRVVVATDERIVPHLAHRPRIYIFPASLADCEWVLVNLGAGSEANLKEWKPERDGSDLAFRSTKGEIQRFTVVEQRGALFLLRRPS
jgi:uncharacterized membrane protein